MDAATFGQMSIPQNATKSVLAWLFFISQMSVNNMTDLDQFVTGLLSFYSSGTPTTPLTIECHRIVLFTERHRTSWKQAFARLLNDHKK